MSEPLISLALRFDLPGLADDSPRNQGDWSSSSFCFGVLARSAGDAGVFGASSASSSSPLATSSKLTSSQPSVSLRSSLGAKKCLQRCQRRELNPSESEKVPRLKRYAFRFLSRLLDPVWSDNIDQSLVDR